MHATRWDAHDAVLYAPADRVGYITLNRPEDRNVVTVELAEAISRIAHEAANDDRIDAVVLAATGSSFCTGAHPGMAGAVERLRQIRVPVVAAIRGEASGAGLELALAASIRIATPDAALGPLGNGHGFHSNAATRRLVGDIGLAAAMHLTRARTPVDASWAVRHKLLRCVVPADELLTVADALARRHAGGRRAA